MSDVFTFEVVVECHEVEAQFFGYDVQGGTTSQCWIHVHHAGIETIAGVGCHIVLWFQVIVTLIPMAESDYVAMCELTSFWNTCRARGIEENEEALRSNRSIQSIRSIQKFLNIFGQEYVTLVFINDRT